MSKLLIEEPAMQVLPTLAVRIGLNEAICLQQLHFALQTYETRVIELDGQRWFKADLDWWGEELPWWSRNTIRRAFKALAELGLVRTRRGQEGNVYTIVRDAVDSAQSERSEPEATDQSGLSDSPSWAEPGAQDGPPCVEREEQQRNSRETSLSAGADDDSPDIPLPGLEPPPPAKTGPTPVGKDAPPHEDPAAQEEVWDHFVATFQPGMKNLSPSRRRLIAKGMKELWDPEHPRQGLETCKLAITGLKSWRQKKPGDETLSAIFASRPGGSGLGDQIQFFADQAGAEATLDPSVPLVNRDRILRRRVQVVEMVAEPDHGPMKQRGEAALAWLRDHAQEEPVIEGRKVTGWKKVTPGVAYSETVEDYEGFGP